MIAGADGVVTTLDCAPGHVWSSGAVPMSVNDRALVALHTSRPLWRDLHGGERGPDVLALQTFLREEGFNSSDTSRFDKKTSSAWRAFQRDKGIGVTGIGFQINGIIQLPEAQITIEKCPVAVGASISPGTIVATGVPSLTQLHASMPESLTAGARTLTLGATTAAVDETGTVLEPNLFASEPRIMQGEGATDGGEVEATLRLAQSLKVAMVPPSAVFGIIGRQGCVADGAKAVPVTIVSSTLGQTAVAFPVGVKPTKVDAVAPSGLECN